MENIPVVSLTLLGVFTEAITENNKECPFQKKAGIIRLKFN